MATLSRERIRENPHVAKILHPPMEEAFGLSEPTS